MQREEARATTRGRMPNNVVVRPCPRCPMRSIATKHPYDCFHMTCASCRLKYCGVCGFVNTHNTWVRGHDCVDGNNISMQSEPRRRAIFSAYQEAMS